MQACLRVAARLLDAFVKRATRWQRRLESRLVKAETSPFMGTQSPPGPREWDRLYSAEVPAVQGLSSVVARALQACTQEGDLLLEAGCGSGSLSAELAHAGRRVELADFSSNILSRACQLFVRSGLVEPEVHQFDMTRPWPLSDQQVDTVWSSGVLEHWTDEELLPIVREMARVSRKSVVALVPYAGSALYRFGKWHAETRNVWPYGRELPRATLRPLFEQAGLTQIHEQVLWAPQSAWFLHYIDPDLSRLAGEWLHSLPADDPILAGQGYLLLIEGKVSSV